SLNPTHGAESTQSVTVKTRFKKGVRAYYASGDKQIMLDHVSPVKTWIHEFGHALEQTGEVHEMAKGFLYKRVGTEEPTQLKTLNSQFSSTEYGREDEFGRAFDGSQTAKFYVGKYYKDDTEILS